MKNGMCRWICEDGEEEVELEYEVCGVMTFCCINRLLTPEQCHANYLENEIFREKPGAHDWQEFLNGPRD